MQASAAQAGCQMIEARVPVPTRIARLFNYAQCASFHRGTNIGLQVLLYLPLTTVVF
jgi:hypothetical protein